MWKLSPQQKDQIASRYSSGESTIALGEAFGVSHVAISGILHRRGIQMRTQSESHRRLPLNEDAFVPVTEHSAYWAGFLMADGCVFGNAVAIVLSPIDVRHLEKFRDFLGSGHQISWVKEKPGTSRRDVVRIEVKSARLTASLARFGVVAGKTETSQVQILADDRHFWRGVVDGDGWIGLAKRPVADNARLDLVGSKPLMTQFASFVSAVRPSANISPRVHKSIYRVGLSGGTARAIIRHLYTEAEIGLDRKIHASMNILASGRNVGLHLPEIPAL
jgi:hypothetical protein